MAVGAVFWGVDVYSQGREKKAAVSYAAVMEKWPGESADTQKWETAATELEGFIRENAGTESAVIARLDLAVALFHLRRFDVSAKWAEEAATKAPHGSSLGMFGLYHAAMALQAQGKMDEALARWTMLKGDAYFGPAREADWRMGMLYAAQKEYAKAADAFDQAMKAPGSYPASAVIENDLAGVRTLGGIAGEPAVRDASPKG